MTAEIDKTALKSLMDLVGGDPEDLQEFIDDFSELAPSLAGEMRSGHTEGNWDKVRIAAHSLKSNARDLGAPELSILCETLEKKCKTEDFDNAPQLIADISVAQISACEALARIDLSTL